MLLIISLSGISQKQGNIWYFGIRAGLNFSTGIPVAIFDGKTGTDVPLGNNQEGTASISDSTGNLLFYTGGATIWNRNHNPMPNGSGIMGGVSSTQTSIIVPEPGSNNLFYIFTTDEFQSYSAPLFPKGYRYSVIDMCRDSTKGDVLIDQKNILLADSSTEKLAVCEDASRNGYWILGHKMFSDAFLAWHLTPIGISAPVISYIGTIHGRPSLNSTTWFNGSAQGQMKFNAQGTKVALAIGNYDPSTIDLFDFNNNTGLVSNFCHIAIDSLLGKRSYGVEFSPDGSKLYAGVSGGFGGKRLYQYDLTANAGNCNSISASQNLIYQSNVNSLMYGMQLAADNKIYSVSGLFNDLGRINFPDLLGSACNFDSSAISLFPAINSYSLPSFIAGYKYHNGVPCQVLNPPIDSSCRINIQTRPYPNPFIHTIIVNKNPTLCTVTMNIYNMIGQLVLKGKTINDGHNEIHFPNLSAGIYYYNFISNGNVILSGKVLKL
jgi:hypothetical protein